MIPPMEALNEYELREARSEIARHHSLIAELRNALRWALKFRLWMSADELKQREEYLKLLDRQVG